MQIVHVCMLRDTKLSMKSVAFPEKLLKESKYGWNKCYIVDRQRVA